MDGAAARGEQAPIRLLPADIADQIAAGEVVERPASIVKELLDNAIDADATRVELELVAGGTARIAVVDDGRGIAAEQLILALTRHATSKLASAADLVEPAWLGFRGEALASIAAVAHVTLESRPAGAATATRLRAPAGLAPTLEPCAGPPGTRVEIAGLFANVPARRKFLRAPATEFSHCLETVLRIAIVHPQLALRVRHEGRVVFEAPRESIDARVERILARRGAGALRRMVEDIDGVSLQAWLGRGTAERGELTIIVRRRVVRERAIARIVREAFDDPALVACLVVEPGRGDVDVNVHPQKAEVRFADPQHVYAAVRRLCARAAAADEPRQAPAPSATAASPIVAAPPAIALPQDTLPLPLSSSPATGHSYALRTAAASADYARARDERRVMAEALSARNRLPEPTPEPAADEAAAPVRPLVPARDEPVLLDVLPGPLALVRHGDALLAIDLRALRGYLLQRRLLQELGGGEVVAQALLVPAVVPLDAESLALCDAAHDELATLGLVVERFGEASVIVRAVPASLRRCIDELDAAALLQRVLPYLRARRAGGERPLAGALAEYAAAAVAPRFARSFVRELFELGVPLHEVPGVQCWSAAALGRGPGAS
ncbi:MAG: DNA mismatch repair endonuclease MutL [Nannocystaceae bacterium]|nr:DNA mismatch repair endonuclease MutL [Nannocystaceae bacterium]